MARTVRTRLLIIFSVFFVSTSVVTSAIAAGTPRMWAVTGTSERGTIGKFYILAVTHNALAVEYDDYLEKVVVPIALKADVFLHEASVSSPTDFPACPNALADTEKNREILRQAYEEVAHASAEFAGPAPEPPGITEQDRIELRQAMQVMARNRTSKLTEYGLIAAMKTYLDNTALQHPEKLATADQSLKLQVANYLVKQRVASGKRDNESIDEKLDLFNAYCNIDPALRGRYLLHEITRYDPIKNPLAPKEMVAYANVAFAESLRLGYLTASIAATPDDEFDRHLICDRNDKWLATMRQKLGQGIRFYALGAAHVLQPGPTNPKRCDGLLSRLRKEGFSVTLVK